MHFVTITTGHARHRQECSVRSLPRITVVTAGAGFHLLFSRRVTAWTKANVFHSRRVSSVFGIWYVAGFATVVSRRALWVAFVVMSGFPDCVNSVGAMTHRTSLVPIFSITGRCSYSGTGKSPQPHQRSDRESF